MAVRNRIDPRGLLANEDAEAAVLGSILMDAGALVIARQHLQASDFWLPDHAAIYQAMCEIFDDGHAIDAVMLGNYLSMRGQGRQADKLAGLVAGTPTSIYVESYARIVQELATRRELLRYGARVTELAANEDIDGPDVLGAVMTEMRGVLDRQRVTMQHIAQPASDLQEFIADRVAHPGTVWGLPSSIPALTNLTGGFTPGVVVIGGRPSHGKTAFALQEAEHLAMRGYPVAIFSLETTVQSLMLRMACRRAHVPSQAVRTGRISHDQERELYAALAGLTGLPIYISYNAAPTVAEIYAEVSRLKMQHDLKAVFVDYLQLIDRPKANSTNDAIAAISRSLKVLAIEQGLVLYVVSQLNRAVESRDGNVPTLADLRDSGAIEQDADAVLFVHSPERVALQKGIKPDQVPDEVKGRVRLILAKQKEGPLGDMMVRFIAEWGEFADIAAGEEPPY
ncbi:MAG: replicative DNA helicase [bacterium]